MSHCCATLNRELPSSIRGGRGGGLSLQPGFLWTSTVIRTIAGSGSRPPPSFGDGFPACYFDVLFLATEVTEEAGPPNFRSGRAPNGSDPVAFGPQRQRVRTTAGSASQGIQIRI